MEEKSNELPTQHDHPHAPGTIILGARLLFGCELQKTDVYASTTGKWEPCPCPGLKLQSEDVVWIRPTK